MEFSDKLKAVRKELKLTQAEMAKGLGVAYTTLNRWENNKFKPNYDAQRKFEEFCLNREMKL